MVGTPGESPGESSAYPTFDRGEMLLLIQADTRAALLGHELGEFARAGDYWTASCQACERRMVASASQGRFFGAASAVRCDAGESR